MVMLRTRNQTRDAENITLSNSEIRGPLLYKQCLLICSSAFDKFQGETIRRDSRHNGGGKKFYY